MLRDNSPPTAQRCSKEPLTDSEKRGLAALCSFIDEKGRGPTYPDLMERLPIRTTNGVAAMLKRLRAKGWLRWAGKGKARLYNPIYYPDGRPFPSRAELIERVSVTELQRDAFLLAITGDTGH